MSRREWTDLSDILGGTEAPASINVRLTDFITSVTTTVWFRGEATVTRTAVARGPLFVESIEVVAWVGGLGVWDLVSALVEASFKNLMGNVVLDFPTHVHDV